MKCAECGQPSNGVFCLIDFILVMKETGIDNKIIRDVYRHSLKKYADQGIYEIEVQTRQ